MEWGLVQGTVTALAWRGARSRPARVREDSGWRLPFAPTTGVATEPTNARQSSGTPGRHGQTQRPPSPSGCEDSCLSSSFGGAASRLLWRRVLTSVSSQCGEAQALAG